MSTWYVFVVFVVVVVGPTRGSKLDDPPDACWGTRARHAGKLELKLADAS